MLPEGARAVKGADRIAWLLLAIALVALVSMALALPVTPADVASICQGSRAVPRTQQAMAAPGPAR